VTNLAWHLCDEADREQILISPRIYGAVEALVESETVGELRLKGSSRPILVSNIIGLRGPLPTSVKPPCHSDRVGGRPLPLPVAAMTSLQAHRENVMAAPVRYRRRGWTLKHKDMCLVYDSSYGMAAVTSEVPGIGADKAKDRGAWHAAASH
jgi:hypothetical protein